MRLLTARWTPGLPPLCHDDTRIKLGKERGPNAERLCSSYEAMFSLGKGCDSLSLRCHGCSSDAAGCSPVQLATVRLKEVTRYKTKKVLLHTLPKDQVLALARPRGGDGGPGEICLIVRVSLTFVGRVAGKCQQNAASETEAGFRWAGLFLLHKAGCRLRTDLRYERVLCY